MQRQITKRALLARINYRLAKVGQRLNSSRSAPDIEAHGKGSYVIVQHDTGGLVLALADDDAVVAYAKEQDIMKPLEVLEMQP